MFAKRRLTRARHFLFDLLLNTGISDNRQTFVVTKDSQIHYEKAHRLAANWAEPSASGCASTAIFLPPTDIDKVEVQCAAIDGQARLEESAGGEAQRSSVIGLTEPLATTSNQRLGEQVI